MLSLTQVLGLEGDDVQQCKLAFEDALAIWASQEFVAEPRASSSDVEPDYDASGICMISGSNLVFCGLYCRLLVGNSRVETFMALPFEILALAFQICLLEKWQELLFI